MEIIWKYIYIYISADPGLSQGRGGAWDHRRCGTTALSNCAAKATGSETSQTVPGSISKLLKLPEAADPSCSPAAPTTGKPVLGRGRPFLQLQQVPEAVSVSFYGGSRLPCNVFLWRFKAAVCQPSKLAKAVLSVGDIETSRHPEVGGDSPPFFRL